MNKINIILVCLFISLSFSKSYTQESIQLTERIEIQLDETKRIQSGYVFGIERLKFKTKQQAQQYFNAISDNRVIFKVNYKLRTVTLELLTKNLQNPWSIKDWNAFFREKQKRYLKYYKGI